MAGLNGAFQMALACLPAWAREAQNQTLLISASLVLGGSMVVFYIIGTVLSFLCPLCILMVGFSLLLPDMASRVLTEFLAPHVNRAREGMRSLAQSVTQPAAS